MTDPNTASENQASKSSGLKWLFAAGLFMLIGMMTLIYLGRDSSTIVNAPMPDLDLVPIHLTEKTPSNDSLRGKVVVYHFWGTWCPPCRVEYPEFYKVYTSWKDNPNVEFVSVSCESAPGLAIDQLKSDTVAYLKQIDATMPVYADPAVYTRVQITKMLSAGGFAYPCTLLVDKTGTVRNLWRGYSKNGMTQLSKRIDEMLKGS